MLNLVFILLLSIALLVFFSGSQLAFLCSVLIGTSVGIYQLYLILTRPRLIRFSNIMSFSLLLGYAASTAIYAGQWLLTNFTFDFEYSIHGLPYSQTDLSIALMLVFFSSTLLIFISRLERPIFSNPDKISDALNTRGVNRLVWLSIVFLIIAFAVGDLGYMGTQANEVGNITALGAVSYFITPIILVIAIVSFSEENKKSRYLLLIAITFYILALFLLGRRVLFYSLLLAVIGFVSAGKSLPKYSVKKWLFFLIIGLIVILTIYIGFHYFYAIRVLLNNTTQNMSIFELLRESTDIFLNDFSIISAAMSKNLADRPFILSYLASFVFAQSIHSPLWGEEFFYAIKVAIPSLIFPEKTAVLPLSVEEFTHPAFGFYVFDGPNTIVTAGLNDFWFVGAVFYPILLVGIYIFIRRLLQNKVPELVYYLVMLRLIYQVIYVEQSLAGILTTGLRDLMLIAIVFYFFLKLPFLAFNKN